MAFAPRALLVPLWSARLLLLVHSGCYTKEALMQQQRFHLDDRVRILQPVGWLPRGCSGTVVRVFFGTDTYGVRFDHQTSIRVVMGQELEQTRSPS